METIKDVAGREVKVGDVVAYGTTRSHQTVTRLFIVHSIDTVTKKQLMRTLDAQTGVWGSTYELYDELRVRLRAFKHTYWSMRKESPAETYVCNIWYPDQLVKIDDLSCLDPNDAIHKAILEHVRHRLDDTVRWPFPERP